jgi:hypothetical protein
LTQWFNCSDVDIDIWIQVCLFSSSSSSFADTLQDSPDQLNVDPSAVPNSFTASVTVKSWYDRTCHKEWKVASSIFETTKRVPYT